MRRWKRGSPRWNRGQCSLDRQIWKWPCRQHRRSGVTQDCAAKQAQHAAASLACKADHNILHAAGCSCDAWPASDRLQWGSQPAHSRWMLQVRPAWQTGVPAAEQGYELAVTSFRRGMPTVLPQKAPSPLKRLLLEAGCHTDATSTPHYKGKLPPSCTQLTCRPSAFQHRCCVGSQIPVGLLLLTLHHRDLCWKQLRTCSGASPMARYSSTYLHIDLMLT